MSKSRALCYLLCFALLFAVVGGLVGERVLAVQESSNGSFVLPPGQEEPSPKDVIEVKCDYPTLVGESGDSIEFHLELLWKGDERRRFDMAATSPSGWKAEVFTLYGGYPEKPIPTLEMEPATLVGNKVKIVVEPMPGNLPDPGDYVVIFEANSGDIRGTMELIARVKPYYEFAMLTQTLQLNMEVTAGEENHLAILLMNLGSAPIENLNFTSIEPEDWTITYNPGRIDSLESGMTQEVDVVIMPPKKTVAGDWPVTLRAKSAQVVDELVMRVTVLTPTIWGWVGILIAVAVIAGAGVVFWRLGRG